MEYFKNYQKFTQKITEAIKYSEVESYLKIKRKREVLKRLDNIFNKLKNIKNSKTSKRDDRIYIPFINTEDNKFAKSPTHEDIEEYLFKKGYEIVDYKLGLAIKNEQKIKIGKLLNKFSKSSILAKQLYNEFNVDVTRQGKNITNSYIVFSRHPYDIAGMSTDRGWDSCMNINKGVYKKYIKEDIIEGTIISYLISSDDMNIYNPIARLLIKPFVNSLDSTDVVYFTEKVYGTAPSNFKINVDKILENVQDIKFGRYDIKPNLYCDLNTKFRYTNSEIKSEEEIIQFLKNYDIENYIINDDLSIEVQGDVDLRDIGLTKLPVKFSKIIGNFDISNNNLVNLKGSPQIVKGSFYCFENNLNSLSGGPKRIGFNFDCRDNNISSLKGGPIEVGMDFRCDNNKLKSLSGAPKSIPGDFSCTDNLLKSLKDSPENVRGDFDCTRNNLSSLLYSPKEVDGNFLCMRNKIESLKGITKKIGGKFNCSDNLLLNLKDGPSIVKGNYECLTNPGGFSEYDVRKYTVVLGKVISGNYILKNPGKY